MKMMRILLVLVALGVVALPLSAQDSQPEAENPPAEDGATERPPPTPEDDVFIPSEELAADEEVTFPVDI